MARSTAATAPHPSTEVVSLEDVPAGHYVTLADVESPVYDRRIKRGDDVRHLTWRPSLRGPGSASPTSKRATPRSRSAFQASETGAPLVELPVGRFIDLIDATRAAMADWT